ncbi:MAG TPA: phage terminase large subunit [Verrucomicrobiae bacterium]|jgi:predicted phage terminase large subunit-like protein|nr:phage terminase large subunit [Verrucomicrobiae bacterium]
MNELRPQPGKQETFLKSSADIAIFGGSAGSGKSFALLLEQLYDVANPGFRSVIFRRTVPMLRQPGGLLDTSEQVFPLLSAKLNQSLLEWQFPTGANVKLAGMELETDRFGWQGSQIALICFDEIQEFAECQFWFLFSRNRSMSGVRTRIRATCNPDCDSWLRNFLGWWIDDASGLPIPERAGVLRWFVRRDDALTWGDTRQELVDKFGADTEPKSVTFIPALVTDNQILLKQDPAYLSNLKALPLVERERLLNGNWNVRATAGNYFRREWFQIVDAPPTEIVGRVRFWDRAASEQKPGSDPDATVGLLLSKDMTGAYYVEHVAKMFCTPGKVQQAMVELARQDGPYTIVAFHQDPGSAGVEEAENTVRALDGFNVRFTTATGSKEVRAKPVSAQAEAGRIKIVRAGWNADFIRILENFPTGKHDDEVDGLSGAHAALLAPTGGWDEASLRGTTIGGVQNLLPPRRIYERRFSHQQISGAPFNLESHLKSRGLF